MPFAALYLRSVRSVSAGTFQKEIGRPNAAKYDLSFYDGKLPYGPRISPPFWGIIASWPEKQGDPGLNRARKRVGRMSPGICGDTP